MKTIDRCAAVLAVIATLFLGAGPCGGEGLDTIPVVAGQTATLLTDGRWLLLGGTRAAGASAEARLWDRRDGSLVELPGQLTHARAWHSATLLPDGGVLV